MGDAKSADLKTLENRSTTSSIDDIERKMILLKIEENEKSCFDDSMDENEWEETENSVTQTIDDSDTKRSIPEEWIDEYAPLQVLSDEQQKQIQPAAPHSYYELMDLNGEPVESTVRLARVPSQYQLDELSEMFIFDVPQNYTMRPTSTDHCQPLPANIISADQDNVPNINDWTNPCYVTSEYVSELLM
ncbi:unnamed protein product [Caenorhabditis brenneri]